MKRPGLSTGWIVGIVVAAFVLLTGAAATTVVLFTKRDAGSYAQPPTCADITREVSDLPPLESEQATGNTRRCHFADSATGKTIDLDLAISTADEQRLEFRRHLDADYVPAKEGPPGQESAWTRDIGDGSFCSLVVLDSNALFKVDLRHPGLVREPQGSVEPEWLCQTEVRLLWLDFYLLARKA